MPYFCSGCPHNTSTRLPEGSSALAGIGCHFMASWMDRDTEGLIQMGGEGANWITRSKFNGGRHVFQNLGDGTFYHSGSLAIRQAVAADTNITFKILYNDAVAMTGGQPVDGPISVPAIASSVRAEGIERIAIVSDEPEQFDAADFPQGITFSHRRDLDAVQRERRMERELITEFEAMIDKLVLGLTADNIDHASDVAALFMDIRGYGPVKEQAIEDVRARVSMRLCPDDTGDN